MQISRLKYGNYTINTVKNKTRAHESQKYTAGGVKVMANLGNKMLSPNKNKH